MTHDDASTAAEGAMPAAEVLEARLEPAPRGPVRRTLRTVGAIAWAAVGGDGSELGPEAHLVLARIDTGEVVLRTSAGSVSVADPVLQRVRLELATLTMSRFAERWPITGAHGA